MVASSDSVLFQRLHNLVLIKKLIGTFDQKLRLYHEKMPAFQTDCGELLALFSIIKLQLDCSIRIPYNCK